MNVSTRTESPTRTAAHADDMAVAAYLTARKLGADPVAARRAYDSAYADALKG